MSPASSGVLEVERYIGACLITSQNQGRHKKSFVDQRYQGCNPVDRWSAGGMPLISYHQRWRRPDNHNPLSRLAVHTQGAPLILSNRYNNNNNNNNNSNNKKRHKNNSNQISSSGHNHKVFDAVNNKSDLNSSGADAVSVASDESSGSNNSETCLPRIIKPRKRRKKDRKPPHLLRPVSQDGSFSTDSGSPDVVDSPQIISFVPYFTYLTHKSEAELFADPTPNLHHSFDDLEDFDLNGNQSESSCQCKYCDPTGQIWDIDRSCYSPYLTTPEKSFLSESNMLTKSYSSSLLDCLSSLSLDDCKTSAPSSPSSGSRSSRDLEVSTEIVTSLNGHRDLEIRFFSQSSRTKEISGSSGVFNRAGGNSSMALSSIGD